LNLGSFTEKEIAMLPVLRPILSVCLLAATALANAAGFTLSSPTIAPNSKLSPAQVFNGFGCSGQNISPALNWRGAPAGTKSFAVTFYDPDAPTGSGWWHWVVFNLPASTTSLPQGAGAVGSDLMPAGAVQGRTDFGVAGFGGACPPQGAKPHRFIFTVHALKIEKIEVPADASAALVGFMINANRLGKASFTATYGR
jgi:Raf kinase inhibitor-like YbhB/YbcL family protein